MAGKELGPSDHEHLDDVMLQAMVIPLINEAQRRAIEIRGD